MDNMSFIETDGIPEFAHGLKILLFDHDTFSLMYTASVLEQYSFNVTAIEQASVALSMISEQKDHYELVMASINMSDIESVSFLHALLEKDIPVILISSEMNADITRKALDKGASIILEKPIPLEDLKNVWRHVYRKTNPMEDIGKPNCEEKIDWPKDYQESSVLRPSFGGIETEDGALCRPDTGHYWNGTGLETDLEGLHSYSIEGLFPTESQKQKASGMKQPADDTEEQGKQKKLKPTVEQTDSDSIARNQEGISKKHSNDKTDKKERINWTSDLHFKFTTAISALGDQKARPKAIMNMMGVENLTMRQVASHLQKYKNQVRRINETGIFTGRTSLSKVSGGNEFVPPKQSSLVYQKKPGTSRFGVGGKPTESTTPNSLTRSSICVASFDNHDYRMQNLNSSHGGLSRYGNTNNPNDSLRTDGWLQNMNQIPETSSFAYKTGMKEILKKKLKVTENLPGMTSMTSEVDPPNMSTNTFQLPDEPPAVHQKQNCTPALTDPINSINKETPIAGTTEVLELQKMNLPGMNYSTPEADSPYMSANAFQFSNEVSVANQEQNCTLIVSAPMNSETRDEFSTEDQRSELFEPMPMNLPSMIYMTPDSASVNQEQYYAPVNTSSSETQNSFSTEVAGTNELLELLLKDSPSMEYMTTEDASPHKSENASQLPNEPLNMDLEQYRTPSRNANNLGNLQANFNDGSQKLDTLAGEAPPAILSNDHQHYTPAFTVPFAFQNQNKVSPVTTELQLLEEQTASSNAKNLQNLPTKFNSGSQKLDTITGEAPPAISLNEHQHCTPSFTVPFDSQNQNKVSDTITGEAPPAISLNEHQHCTPSFTIPFDSQNQNKVSDTITGEAPPAISLNEHQHCTPSFTIPFDSQNQNKVSPVTTELGEQKASSNAKDIENLPVYFNSGSQELNNLTGDAPPAISSNEHQPLSEYADLLKMLEADDEYNSFGNAPYAGNFDEYREWLERTLFGDSTEQH